MKIKIRISCHYFENKAFYNGGEKWKHKGVHEFEITNVDAHDYMYDEGDGLYEKFIESKCDDFGRFEIIQITPVFSCETISFEDMENEVTPDVVISEAGVLI